MDTQDYTTAFMVSQTPKQAFDAINDVTLWWTENLTGQSHQQGDEFAVQFWDVHYSKQKLVEVIPDEKIVWLVTESRLNFLEDKTEWNGTKIVFDISPKNGKTEVRFTQVGLVPQIECYNACSGAWSGYINNSLRNLIETGKGDPTRKED